MSALQKPDRLWLGACWHPCILIAVSLSYRTEKEELVVFEPLFSQKQFVPVDLRCPIHPYIISHLCTRAQALRMSYDAEKEHFLLEEDVSLENICMKRSRMASTVGLRLAWAVPLSIVFFASLSANILYTWERVHGFQYPCSPKQTRFGMSLCSSIYIRDLIRFTASLSESIAMPWLSNSSFYGVEEEIADKNWENIDINNGSIALSDKYAEVMGLPLSQRFPWDSSKGLYVLNGYHSMHCLVRANLPGLSDCPMKIINML